MLFSLIFVFAIPSMFQSSIEAVEDSRNTVKLHRVDINKITQGSILLIEVPSHSKTGNHVTGLLNNNGKLKFFKEGSNSYSLYGIDLEDAKSLNFINIEIDSFVADKTTTIVPLTITEGSYGVQRISVPKKMVNPEGKNLERAVEEAALIKKVYSKSIGTRTWNEPFIMPLEGRLSSKFGLKRFYNGIKKSPHNGLDIAAPRGRPVKASNNGVIVYAGDLYYTGNTVIIDHGLGLFTAYYHLSKMNVLENDFISRGDILGLVGTTGRSTGPHLHWGVKLNGARVSPNDLIKSSLIINKKNN